MQKNAIFSKTKQFRLWCLLTTYGKLCKLNWALEEPIIGSLQSKMAEIRHIENRHDVIFFCRGWSILKKIEDWCRMTCRLRRCGRNRNQMYNFNMADVWANSMACYPRATYHIAGCCHLVKLLSRFQSHMPHCRVVRIRSGILKIVFRHIFFVFNAV